MSTIGKKRVKSLANGVTQNKDKSAAPPNEKNFHRLSPQKRHEINQLVDKLLKVSTAAQASTPNAAKDWETHLEIDKLINKIIRIESELKIPLHERTAQDQEEFINWLESNSAELRGVGIREFPGQGLGFMALTDLAEGDLFVAVPRKVMITSETVRSSKLGNLVAHETMLRLMPHVALALFLLLERFSTDPPSFWQPYLRMLPSAYTTVMYFTVQDLQELKGSPTLEGALKQCRNIARQYAYFYKLFQCLVDPALEVMKYVFTYEQYRWAVSTVMTRQNFIPCEDESGMCSALIPLWDMANHSNGMISTEYNLWSDRECECVAWRPFSAGEQVFIFYGQRSNSELLIHNGFVYPDNVHDNVRLRLGVAKSDPLYAERAKVLDRLSLPTAYEFLLLRGPEPIEGQLLAFLRVFSMQLEHLQHWAESDKVSDLTHPDCALDSTVETKAWQFILARLKLLQSLYPTTIEEDLKILKGDLPVCRRLSVQLRLAEKSILMSAVEYVQTRDKP